MNSTDEVGLKICIMSKEQWRTGLENFPQGDCLLSRILTGPFPMPPMLIFFKKGLFWPGTPFHMISKIILESIKSDKAYHTIPSCLLKEKSKPKCQPFSNKKRHYPELIFLLV
jgi:hypothetical protein